MSAAPHRTASTQASSKPVILSVAFPYAPVGPKAVGGAEVICSQIEAALAAEGFTSVVVAHEASAPQGQLYPTHVPSGTITDAVRAAVEESQQANIDRAFREHPVALVHMHGLDFNRYLVPPSVPVLVTLHLPPAWYPDGIWALPDNYHFVCVSEKQRTACPHAAQSRLRVIENGVPLPDPETLRAEGRYALMLARICPEKNLHVGFDAARLAGMPVILGGEVFPYEAHQRYLDEEIRPRLSRVGKSHEARTAERGAEVTARFLGPVAGEEKHRLLTRAACLLLPSLAPETSSLVAMEAMAAGVPVIAMAVGAVPEIVEDGRTGFLIQPTGDAVTHMSEAIRRLPALDRTTCRRVAEERFPLSRMVEGYCRLYRELAVPLPLLEQELGPTTDSGSTSASEHATERTPIIVEELRDGLALEALAPQWEALWGSDRTATPFQHPAWLLPWWHQFGPDGELHSIALREELTGALVSLLPLYVYEQPDTGRRQLLLIGAGTTDYLDGMWSTSEPNAACLALRHLLRGTNSWNQLSLQQLRPASPLVGALRAAALPLVAGESCSTLLTSEELPPKICNNVRRYRRLAEAQGTLACRLASDPEAALAVFEKLVALHSRRWEERGEEGVLRDQRVLAHHRESIPKLLQAGLLRLFHLTLNGETIGVLYGLADAPHTDERRFYLYLVGFDARFATLSPGSLLLHEAWLQARQEGCSKVDLLRGGESYKQLWGAQTEATLAVELGREEM